MGLGFELDPVLMDRKRFGLIVATSFRSSTFEDLLARMELSPLDLSGHIEQLKESGYVEIRRIRRLFRKPEIIIEGTEKARRTFDDWLRYLKDKLREP